MCSKCEHFSSVATGIIYTVCSFSEQTENKFFLFHHEPICLLCIAEKPAVMQGDRHPFQRRRNKGITHQTLRAAKSCAKGDFLLLDIHLCRLLCVHTLEFSLNSHQQNSIATFIFLGKSATNFSVESKIYKPQKMKKSENPPIIFGKNFRTLIQS